MKKALNSKYAPFIVCFVIMAVVLCSLYTGWGDEIHFNVPEGESIFSYLKTQYLTTHAKVIADFFIIVLLRFPQSVWAIITAALYSILAYSLSRLLLRSENGSVGILSCWFIVCLMFIYNFLDVSGAGWYATTINYVWPLSCGVFSLLPIRHAIDGVEEKKSFYPLYIISAIIGCSQEQMAAVVLCIYLIFSIYLFRRKKLSWLIVVQLIVSSASLLFLLSSPGNASRAQSEAEFWYPLFLDFGPLKKLYLGIVTTAAESIFTDNPIVIAFIILLPIFTFRLSSRAAVRSAAFIPLILTLVNNLLYPFFVKFYPMLENIVAALKDFTIAVRNRYGVSPADFSSILFAVSLLYILPVVLCAFFAFCESYSKDNTSMRWTGTGYVALLAVLAGFASRFVIGFSPTMYASGPRTFVFLHFSFISLLAIMFDRCREKISTAALFPPIISAAFLQILRLLYTGSLFN